MVGAGCIRGSRGHAVCSYDRWEGGTQMINAVRQLSNQPLMGVYVQMDIAVFTLAAF